MKIRLAAPIEYDSIVDGEGIRAVIWTQGCPHNCVGCHNPITHDMKGGYVADTDDLKQELDDIKYHNGITLSGGDPFMQVEACLDIAKHAKNNGMDVWCYTGFTYDQLLEMSKKNQKIISLLENIDILVDGKFDIKQFSLDLYYKGSQNQRVIDVQKTLIDNEIVLVDRYSGKKTYENPKPENKYMFI